MLFILFQKILIIIKLSIFRNRIQNFMLLIWICVGKFAKLKNRLKPANQPLYSHIYRTCDLAAQIVNNNKLLKILCHLQRVASIFILKLHIICIDIFVGLYTPSPTGPEQSGEGGGARYGLYKHTSIQTLSLLVLTFTYVLSVYQTDILHKESTGWNNLSIYRPILLKEPISIANIK